MELDGSRNRTLLEAFSLSFEQGILNDKILECILSIDVYNTSCILGAFGEPLSIKTLFQNLDYGSSLCVDQCSINGMSSLSLLFNCDGCHVRRRNALLFIYILSKHIKISLIRMHSRFGSIGNVNYTVYDENSNYLGVVSCINNDLYNFYPHLECMNDFKF